MGCAFCLSATARHGRAHARTEAAVQNYFNYFTEIEERFQQRRGSLLLLSTLDWALIETWREAGVPLEAALRGIDAAFDKYETRKHPGHKRKVNGLAWCAQAVMEASEELREAAAGASTTTSYAGTEGSGFEPERVAAHLGRRRRGARCGCSGAPNLCGDRGAIARDGLGGARSCRAASRWTRRPWSAT